MLEDWSFSWDFFLPSYLVVVEKKGFFQISYFSLTIKIRKGLWVNKNRTGISVSVLYVGQRSNFQVVN